MVRRNAIRPPLVVGGLTAPWLSRYSNSSGMTDVPDETDPRLARYPESLRKMLVEQLKGQMRCDLFRYVDLKTSLTPHRIIREPDIMQAEPCAITCRVAPSFMRVGHIELFARRFNAAPSEQTKKELEMIIEHAMFRE